MFKTINKRDFFIGLSDEISSESLSEYLQQIKIAEKSGCCRIFFDFFSVEDLNNHFFDFLFKIKDKFNSINFYNVSTDLLPLLYLMKLDNVVNIYTSEEDALKEKKPIVKRRLELV